MRFIAAIACSLILVSTTALAAQPRSAQARSMFQRGSPCPATGHTKGKCPGYVVDHVIPLCAGGEDAPSNMQWQTVADGKAKDRIERRQCRRR